MLTLAWLTAIRAAEHKGGESTDGKQLIPITVPEARKLISKLFQTRYPDDEHAVA